MWWEWKLTFSFQISPQRLLQGDNHAGNIKRPHNAMAYSSKWTLTIISTLPPIQENANAGDWHVVERPVRAENFKRRRGGRSTILGIPFPETFAAPLKTDLVVTNWVEGSSFFHFHCPSDQMICWSNSFLIRWKLVKSLWFLIWSCSVTTTA